MAQAPSSARHMFNTLPLSSQLHQRSCKPLQIRRKLRPLSRRARPRPRMLRARCLINAAASGFLRHNASRAASNPCTQHSYTGAPTTSHRARNLPIVDREQPDAQSRRCRSKSSANVVPSAHIQIRLDCMLSWSIRQQLTHLHASSSASFNLAP